EAVQADLTGSLAAAAATAALLVSRGSPRARLRLRRRPPQRRRAALVPGAAVAAAGVLMLGPATAAFTVLAVAILVARRRLQTGATFSAGDLALALDVLAGCLAAGASTPAALAAAQVAAPSGVADAFAGAAVALSRGEDPAATWTQISVDVPELAAVSRLCARAATTGAAVADELHRVAAAQRTSVETTRRRRLHRASVWLVLPLGLC